MSVNRALLPGPTVSRAPASYDGPLAWVGTLDGSGWPLATCLLRPKRAR